MKNTTRKKKAPKKAHPYPSNKTLWAYWMQAIEPKSEELNKAFPAYHPQWVQMSQMRDISPRMFISFRQNLGMTREQCAAYLRVSERTIRGWESNNNGNSIPFAAFELLRVIRESVHFKMSNPAWDGWFISGDGLLVSPDLGGNQATFTPSRLNWLSWNTNEGAMARNEVKRLRAELDTAIEENTKLRQMFVAQGVVDELAAMQSTISELMSRIATAKVIRFPVTPIEQLQEKAA